MTRPLWERYDVNCLLGGVEGAPLRKGAVRPPGAKGEEKRSDSGPAAW